MRRIVIMDGMYWEALRLMAKDKGYGSRNELILTILTEVVEREPIYKDFGYKEDQVKEMAREIEKPWNPPLRPVSDEDLKEIFGDEPLQHMMPAAGQIPDGEPELPEL